MHFKFFVMDGYPPLEQLDNASQVVNVCPQTKCEGICRWRWPCMQHNTGKGQHDIFLHAIIFWLSHYTDLVLSLFSCQFCHLSKAGGNQLSSVSCLFLGCALRIVYPSLLLFEFHWLRSIFPLCLGDQCSHSIEFCLSIFSWCVLC